MIVQILYAYPTKYSKFQARVFNTSLLSMKQRNRLKPENPEKLMRLIVVGPGWFDDATWELLIDKQDVMGERRIFLIE